jgi:hypothetical protein
MNRAKAEDKGDTVLGLSARSSTPSPLPRTARVDLLVQPGTLSLSTNRVVWKTTGVRARGGARKNLPSARQKQQAQMEGLYACLGNVYELNSVTWCTVVGLTWCA